MSLCGCRFLADVARPSAHANIKAMDGHISPCDIGKLSRFCVNSSQITDWESFHKECCTALGISKFDRETVLNWARANITSPRCVVLDLADSEKLRTRCPEQFQALVDVLTFVNLQYVGKREAPAFAVCLL
jgi:hypothetical protein